VPNKGKVSQVPGHVSGGGGGGEGGPFLKKNCVYQNMREYGSLNMNLYVSVSK